MNVTIKLIKESLSFFLYRFDRFTYLRLIHYDKILSMFKFWSFV